MSTRCHIIIEDHEYGVNTILYQHSGGYPDGEAGLLSTLVPFVQKFMRHRGWDPEYLPAQLLAHLIVEYKEARRTFLRKMLDKCEDDETAKTRYLGYLAEVDTDFLGFGVSPELHGDTEFIYVITKEAIHVYNGNRTERLTTIAQGKAMMRGTIPQKWRSKVKAA